MEYREVQPAPALRPFVRSYWTLRGSGVAGGIERVIPDGRPELIVDLGVPLTRLRDAGVDGNGESHQPECLFAGQMDRPELFRTRGPVSMFGVTFEADGVSVFSEAPQREWFNQIVPLGDIWGLAARRWEERIRNARCDAERASMTDAFLQSRFAVKRFDPRTAAACRIIRADPAMPIDRVAERCALSRRQLEREFQRRAGVSPKLLARIARLQRALTMRQSRESWAWTRVAHESGYYDQAHLIADFKQFTGAAPTLRESETAMERAFVRE